MTNKLNGGSYSFFDDVDHCSRREIFVLLTQQLKQMRKKSDQSVAVAVEQRH